MNTASTIKSKFTGKSANLEILSHYDATQKALELVRRDAIPPNADMVIRLLSNTGILTEQQLMQLANIKDRTLRRYRTQWRFIDTIPLPVSLKPFCSHLAFSKGSGKRVVLYTLGAVGEVLGQRYENHPLTRYLQAFEDQVTHDVLCNSIYHTIAMRLGVECVRYRNRISATLYNRQGTMVLEPDAMLEITDSGGKKHAFVVEFHNEDTLRRVRGKIERYETVRREIEWADQWELEEFPTILVSWAHSAVATGYVREVERLAGQQALQCRYVGMPIRLILEGRDPLLWKNFRNHQIERIVE